MADIRTRVIDRPYNTPDGGGRGGEGWEFVEFFWLWSKFWMIKLWLSWLKNRKSCKWNWNWTPISGKIDCKSCKVWICSGTRCVLWACTRSWSGTSGQYKSRSYYTFPISDNQKWSFTLICCPNRQNVFGVTYARQLLKEYTHEFTSLENMKTHLS